MLQLLGESAVRSILLAALIWPFVLLFARRNPHIQLAILRWILVGAMAMPALVAWSPLGFSIPIPAEISVPYRPSIESQPWTPAAPRATAPIDNIPAIATSPAKARSLSETWSIYDLAAGFYVLVAAMLLIRQVAGLTYAWKLLSQSARAEGPGDVRLTGLVSAPATIGSTIILPEDYSGWPAPMAKSVLAHEQAHIANGDFYALILAGLHRAIFWFSPLGWWLYAKIATTAEIVCDEVASESIGDRHGYAEILLTFASGDVPPRVLLSISRASTVETRVQRLLSEPANTLSLPQPIRFLLALAAIFGMTSLAWTSVRSTIAEDIGLIKLGALTSVPRVDYRVHETRIMPAFDLTKLRIAQFVVQRVRAHLTPSRLKLEMEPLAPPVIPAAITIPSIREPTAGPAAEAASASVATEMQRIEENTPVIGSETALRHHLKAMTAGQPDYLQMTEEAAATMRAQYRRLRHFLDGLGRIEAVKFRGATAAGEDVYNVIYQHGTAVWIIAPLTADGRISGLRCTEISESVPVQNRMNTSIWGPSPIDSGTPIFW